MRNSPWNTMMSAAIACVATAGIALAADAPSGAVPAPQLPAAVAAALQSVADQCTGVGGKPLTADAVKRVDLTGDGMDDFVLDVGSVNCDGAASIYGDREKGVTVYVGDGKGGATSAFSELGVRRHDRGSGLRCQPLADRLRRTVRQGAGTGFRERELLRPGDRVECRDAEIRFRARGYRADDRVGRRRKFTGRPRARPAGCDHAATRA